MNYLTKYNAQWPERFAKIAAYVQCFISEGCHIHHVGSTSIPSMPAKDIIDLDIECPKGSIRAVIDALAKAGYDHEGDKGLPGREAFCPASEQSMPAVFPPHHLYACESGTHELKKHLAFRDYLIAYPDRAQWLATKKIEVDESAESRDAYIENKSECYSIITSEALKWARD